MLPAGLCAVLVAAVAAQIALPVETLVPRASGEGRAATWTLPDVGVPADLPASVVPNLFTPMRLGGKIGEAAGVDENGDGEEATAPPPPKPVGPLGGSWVLGTVRVGNARSVIIRPALGGSVKLPVGRVWRGWRLVSIADNFALFQRSGKTHRINFGNAPPGANGASD